MFSSNVIFSIMATKWWSSNSSIPCTFAFHYKQKNSLLSHLLIINVCIYLLLVTHEFLSFQWFIIYYCLNYFTVQSALSFVLSVIVAYPHHNSEHFVTFWHKKMFYADVIPYSLPPPASFISCFFKSGMMLGAKIWVSAILTAPPEHFCFLRFFVLF